MVDNTTLPGTGDVIASDDVGGVKYQRVKLSFGADGSAADANAVNPLPVKGFAVSAPGKQSFNRPANATAYSIGDLIANNTSNASVNALAFTGATLSGSGGSGRIVQLIASKSNNAAARIRYHFLKTNHAVTNGDNGLLVFTSLDLDNYIGYMDVSFAGTDDAVGNNGALVGMSYDPPLDYVLSSGDTIYCIAEALTAYTPASGETYAVRPTLEVFS